MPKQELEVVKALIPNQYVPDWKNEETGVKYLVLTFINLDEYTLEKTFITVPEYKRLGIRSYVKVGEPNTVYELTFDHDEEDRRVLMDVVVGE